MERLELPDFLDYPLLPRAVEEGFGRGISVEKGEF
jgi:hypothetical protein